MAIIGVSGKARAGKDLLYSVASKYGWKRLSFADDLKLRARRDFGVEKDFTDGIYKDVPSTEFNNHTCREFLIDLGNLYRKYNPMFWIDQVVAVLAQNPENDYMITDVRYPNEARALKEIGAMLIRLERHPSRDFLVSEETKRSVSETALDTYEGFDVILKAEDNANKQHLKAFFERLMKLKRLNTI